MFHELARRGRQHNGPDFSFENGTVMLRDGRAFVPNRDGVNRWVVEDIPSYRCLGSSFEIVYQLDSDLFVLVEYDDDQFADRRPRARALSRGKALQWLLDQNRALPEVFQSRVRWATGRSGLSTIMRDPGLLEKVRRLCPSFQADRKDDVARLRDLLSRLCQLPLERITQLTRKQVEQALDSYLEVRDAATAGPRETLHGQHDAVPSATASDDRYEWARQVELVRATNQVLSEGTLDKGVLSRSCTRGHVETNGKAGRAARVLVSSFLVWASKRFGIGKEEENQIRNAVIGEIGSRNK